MTEVNTDYLVVGQGIAGTLMAWKLLRAGKKVMIIDNPRPTSASRVSSGIINPYTGKRLAKVAGYDEMLPTAIACYREIEEQLGIEVLRPATILSFHTSEESKLLFEKRMAEPGCSYLADAEAANYDTLFNPPHGCGAIAAYMLDTPKLLAACKVFFNNAATVVEEEFDWSSCVVSASSVRYKDIVASKIICCEGVGATNNPYVPGLPLVPNKGEVLIVSIPGLPRDTIYKKEFTIVPWLDDLFWVGSTFQWSYSDALPTEQFVTNVKASLDDWLQLNYTIVDHIASERPSTVTREAIAAIQNRMPSVAILNGLGTKGSLQGPMLANKLLEELSAAEPTKGR